MADLEELKKDKNELGDAITKLINEFTAKYHLDVILDITDTSDYSSVSKYVTVKVEL